MHVLHNHMHLLHIIKKLYIADDNLICEVSGLPQNLTHIDYKLEPEIVFYLCLLGKQKIAKCYHKK